MDERLPDPTPQAALREDISREYYAILTVVSNYDGWLLIIKGWSVTLSLAGLSLGFQEQHYAMFALAAATGAAFWFLDGLMKGYQYRYYVRMREIEYTAYLLGAVTVGGEFAQSAISAPRIDMSWGFKGFPGAGRDWRAEPPARRTAREIHTDLRRRFWFANVMLPHAVAVVLGLALFIAATQGAWGLGKLPV